MKAIRRTLPCLALGCGAALSALLSACVAPLQAPTPASPPAQALPPQPMPPAPADWHDMPATPGVWQWHREGRTSIARFGDPAGPAQLSLTCDPLAGTISLSRGEGPGTADTMSVWTTSLSRKLAVRRGSDGAFTASLAPRDPLLDAMAFSRGRFALEVPGLASLYPPSWPEIARVIEDCRGPGGRAQ